MQSCINIQSLLLLASSPYTEKNIFPENIFQKNKFIKVSIPFLHTWESCLAKKGRMYRIYTFYAFYTGNCA